MSRTARAAAVAALLLLATGCWPMPGQNADRTGHNGVEAALTAETVGGLRELWRHPGSDGLGGPVLSPGGLHLTSGCTVTTLDPATGAMRWWAPLVDDASLCSGLFTVQRSEPYTTPGGDRVIASVGISRVRAPGYLEAQWTTRVLDAATGDADGSAPIAFVAGARGDRLAGFHEGPIGPFVTGRSIDVGPAAAGAPARGLVVSIQPTGTPQPAEVMLGTDTVVHAGTGILATEPGDGAQGPAVRAFSLDEARPGCGPVTVPPISGSYEVECPLWVTPTDGAPTLPVRSPDGSTLYSRTTAGTLYALDAATGEVRWTASGLGQAGRPALADGTLYVPTGDGRLLAFDAGGCGAPACPPQATYATGTSAAVSTPAVGGAVLYATAGGSAFAFAAGACPEAGCTPLWSGPGSGAPVVSGGQVYVRSAPGTELVAYGLG